MTLASPSSSNSSFLLDDFHHDPCDTTFIRALRSQCSEHSAKVHSGGFRRDAFRGAFAMSFAASARSFWNHPAGPKTIFFWAPTMKWGITAANVKDFSRPPELLSVPQQSAVTLTGLIWCKYALDITPVNYNLMAVNMVMAATGSYQLFRRFSYDQAQAAKAKAT